MVKFQPSKLAMRVRFPLPAHFLFRSQMGVNKCRWTLSDVLTIVLTNPWHQSPKTHTSRLKAPSGLPVLMAWEPTEKVRRLKRSTKTNDAKLARRLAEEWETFEKLTGEKRLTESHCRKVIAEMYERTVGEPLHFRTTREFLTEWVDSKKNETELRAFLKYDQIIREFLAHVGAKADRLLREITPADIRSWRVR
jgi:hypothetical protein